MDTLAGQSPSLDLKLPYADQAEVSSDKLENYLLSETHSVGRAKSRFFMRLGFDRTTSDEFRQELLRIARSNEVVEEVVNPWGVKYIVDGEIQGLNGVHAQLRTVWIIEVNHQRPRLVTAFPG
jgi:hypothetical protein